MKTTPKRSATSLTEDVVRIERALNSAAARLRRVGQRREARDARRAYNTAAGMIIELVKSSHKRAKK